MGAGDWLVVAMAALQAAASAAYLLSGDGWRALYWAAAAVISTSIVMMGK